MTSQRVQRIYVTLVLLQALAASLIWGINTLFLLDSGLSLTEAFVANAAYTAGMVLFEIPTGVVADAWGRRVSYLLGAFTLLLTTVAYLGLWQWHASLGWWIVVSALIGLGFTFFSGATEAWLVDALDATGFRGSLEGVFGRGQVAVGAATLLGSVAGGFLALLGFGVPYVVRSALLVVVIVAAYFWMFDLGFERRRTGSIRDEIATITRNSVTYGVRNRPVRMFMLASPIQVGVAIWVFYAFQPYVIDLFDDPSATYLAGVAAALYASAQMVGGSLVSRSRKFFSSRTSILMFEAIVSGAALIGIGLASWFRQPWGFWVAIALFGLQATLGSVAGPVRSAFINELIPSRQRATVLSLVSLTGSAGGVVLQPALGRVSDVFSLGLGYVAAGAVYVLRIPFILGIKAMHLPSDELAEPNPIQP